MLETSRHPVGQNETKRKDGEKGEKRERKEREPNRERQGERERENIVARGGGD